MKSQKSILILDDDESWRDFHKEILEEEGYAVELATTRQEAVQKLDESPFDVAIVDLRLDEKDPANTEGLEVVKHASSVRPSTLVIVKSAFLTGEIRQELLDLRVFGIIEKDGQSEHLLRLLDAIN